MKFRFIALMILISLQSLFADTVTWYSEYNKALAAAEKENKNIFVLITAPSWCIWCERLEENVLSKPEFQRYLSANYIPLKLLDKINGKANPELANFDFSGYPTVYLYDSKGGYIQNIYTQDPAQMLASMAKYRTAKGKVRPMLENLILPDKYTFSADGGGEYVNNGDGTWTLKVNGSKDVIYDQTKFDFDYLYIQNPGDLHVIALPMHGTDRHKASLVDDQWVWTDLPEVKRIGGDPYFD